MKITDRLAGDHQTFRKMLVDLDEFAHRKPGECDSRRLVRLIELLVDHMMLHAWCEDSFYNPVIRAALPQAVPPLSVAYMDHLESEHRMVDGYLNLLEWEVKARPTIGSWPQTYALFSEGLLAHMRKEEEELFPLSEVLLGAQKLEEISLEFERSRSRAPVVRQHAS